MKQGYVRCARCKTICPPWNQRESLFLEEILSNFYKKLYLNLPNLTNLGFRTRTCTDGKWGMV